MGTTASAECVLLGAGRSWRHAFFADTHHPCLGSECAVPYSAARGKQSVNRQALDELKQQIPLLDYLQAQDWQPVRPLSGGRWMGLCPLHADRKPSFLVDSGKSLFYCYGCGRGGDVIRFAEIYHEVKFPQALALLRQWRGLAPLLQQATDFYRLQLHRHAEAVAYLLQRGVRSPELIEHMRIGYAPGGCLRGWLTQLGYPLSALRQAGLVTTIGYAVLWQAGLHNVTCAMGTHLNAHQFQQLCDGPRTVYLGFDADANGSGPQASQQLAQRLGAHGILTRRIVLPAG